MKKMYLTLYLFVPDPVLDLVPGGRYKVLRSTLYQWVGTRYSKVLCTWEQVQGTRKYLVPGSRYKVLESTLYLPTGIRYRKYLVPQVQGTVLDTALLYFNSTLTNDNFFDNVRIFSSFFSNLMKN